MLTSLRIKNIAVIRSADICFSGGFTALTGETGAGKSIIIDSISLLLGGKASRELIRGGESRADVSGMFEGLSEFVRAKLCDFGIDCDEDSLLLSRSITADGRSTARINGQAVTLAMLREVSGALIAIHGQHDNMRLMQPATHIRLLDAYVDVAERSEQYRQAYAELRRLRGEAKALRVDEAEKNRLRDMLTYQIKEIDAVKLRDGESETLSAERARLQSAEKIKKQTDFVWRALYASEKGSVSLLLGRSVTALEQIADVIPEAGELAARLENYKYEIEDVAHSAHAYADFEGDPSALLDKIEGRLDAIGKLTKKYGENVAEIKKFREKAAARLAELEDSEARLEETEEKCREAEKRARALACEISAVRRAGTGEICKRVKETLAYLDMPGITFCININEAKELGADGLDEVEFMIATNPGEPPAPLAKIASGGELSRIMLALKCVLSENDGIGTMIFDEVDAGISGKTSRKVGVKLKEISRGVQVLSVTHSAQIASLADTHLLISKSEREGRAETEVAPLDDGERVDEIARILGGINITDKQREAAREMIVEAKEI